MDLRRLQAFVAIAELKNFTKAAELLHIAQPALGLKIRKLEEDLEQQLFVRHSRGVMMTEAGKFLLPQARAMLAQASALKQVMRDFSCPPHGRVVRACRRTSWKGSRASSPGARSRSFRTST